MGEMRRFLISEVDEAFCRQCIIQNSVGMQMEGDDDDDLTYSFEVDEDKENPWQPSRSYAAHAHMPTCRTVSPDPFFHSASMLHSTDRPTFYYTSMRSREDRIFSYAWLPAAADIAYIQTFLRIPFTRESWQ